MSSLHHAAMSPERQRVVVEKLCTLMERQQVNPHEQIALLLAMAWGVARRLGWKTANLATYALRSWETHDKFLSAQYEPPEVTKEIRKWESGE